MTSINTDSFQKTLLRLYSDSEGKKVEAKKSEDSFHSVLASVESPQKVPENIKGSEIGKALKLETPILPQLKKTEEISKIVAPSPELTTQIIGDFPIEEETSNIPNIEVKIETDNSIPKIPTVVSSRRIDLGETIADKEEKSEIREIQDIIVAAGKHHGVDPSLGLAIARVESSFNPKAVSSDGHASKGVFQLLDSTGKDIHLTSGITEPYQPFDPSMNSYLGIGHLRRLLDIFSKETPLTSNLSTHAAKSADDLEKLAVAAYNAGEGNVARAQAKALQIGKDPSVFQNIKPYLPEITRGYVDKVNDLRNQFVLNYKDSKVT